MKYRFAALSLALLLAGMERVEASAALCNPGAKLEGQSGSQWYAVTVLEAPNAKGECPVSFDGYGRVWDTKLGPEQLRARGGADDALPAPQAATDAKPNAGNTASTGSTAPDGNYRCHKISSGRLIDIGKMEISGGRAVLPGLPEGWTITAVSVRGTNDRGQIVVAVDYRSASGNSERMDCLPQ